MHSYMNKLIVTKVLILLVCAPLFCQKIPITTSSREALKEYKTGFAFEDNGDLAAAADHYRKATEFDTTFALGHMALAMVQTNSVDRRKYMAKAMRHLSKVSEGEQLWIKGRNTFYGTGVGREELGYFEELVKKYPNDEIAQYLFGYMNHHHGRKNFEKAIECMENALKINPNYVTPYNDLGYAYMEIRDFKNAERIFKKYVELVPNTAAALDSYSDMFLRSGQFEKSIENYDKVIKLDPTYPWAYFGKAANLNFLNRHAEARELLTPLLNFKLGERDTYHVWIAIECSYLDEGKHQLAIDFLKDQLESGKDKHTFVHKYVLQTHIISLCFEYGKAKEGLAAYEQLNSFVQTESQSEETKKRTASLSTYYQAHSLFINHKLEDAENQLSIYDKQGERQGANSKQLLAEIRMVQKRWNDALTLIEQTDIDNPYNQFLKAQCLQSMGKISEAKELYRTIAERNETQSVDYHMVRSRAVKALTKIK